MSNNPSKLLTLTTKRMNLKEKLGSIKSISEPKKIDQIVSIHDPFYSVEVLYEKGQKRRLFICHLCSKHLNIKKPIWKSGKRDHLCSKQHEKAKLAEQMKKQAAKTSVSSWCKKKEVSTFVINNNIRKSIMSFDDFG